MKGVVTNDPLLIDDDEPGGTSAPVPLHDTRPRVVPPGIVTHGNRDSVAIRRALRRLGRVGAKPLEHGLNREKRHVFGGAVRTNQRA